MLLYFSGSLLPPASLIDSAAGLDISSLFTVIKSSLGAPLRYAVHILLFHSSLSLLVSSMNSALGLFLPIFLVGRNGLFFGNTCILFGSDSCLFMRSVKKTLTSSVNVFCLNRGFFLSNRCSSYASPLSIML